MPNIEDLKIFERIKDKEDTNSEVYRLEDKSGNYFAEKIIYGIDQPIYHGIFDRECNALYRLSGCENIVKIYKHSVKEKNGEKLGSIIMEYIDGKTLRESFGIDHGESFKMSDKLGIVKQLLCAVKAAHNNGVIHRDINPNNIMIDQSGNVKVIDFGICKIKEIVSNSTAFRLGTDLYSAPEVHRGSSFATPQSDLYSMGCVMYFLFAGMDPPTDDLPGAVDKNCCRSGDLSAKSILNPLIKKLVSYEAKGRYSCAEEVEETLSELFKRYLEKSYTVVMDIGGNFNRLKKLNLIKKSAEIWELNECFGKEYFSELYIGKRESKDGSRFQYIFLGKRVVVKCDYVESDGYGFFRADDISTAEPKERELMIKKFCKLSAKLDLIDSRKIGEVSRNSSGEVKIIVDEHHEQLISKENIDREFDNSFGVWSDYLEEARKREESNALKFRFESFENEDGILRFNLPPESAARTEDIEKLGKETRFCYEKDKEGKGKKLIYIGEFDSFDSEAGNILSIKLKNPKIELQGKKEICVDYGENLVNIERQSYAFSLVKRENNPHYDLKGILTGITAPGISPVIGVTRFLNPDLNSSQRNAVRIALATDSVAVIQGPPGTGKTSVIIEIIRQILLENRTAPRPQKILLISQSHAAVDKMLEDLSEAERQQLPTIVRIGREEKLSRPVGERFGLECIISRWKESVRKNCRRSAEQFCSEMGVTAAEFEEYFAELEKQRVKSSETSNENEKPNLAIIHAFEDKTANREGTRRLLDIETQWTYGLDNCGEIEKYLIQSADIVAGTCTGFIGNEYVRDMVFDYLIVDEAAKSTFTELAVSLSRAKRAILVGDHKQLPPIMDNDIVRKLGLTGQQMQKLNDGVFKQLYERLPDENKITLDCQYRMHPIIGTLISSTFYDGRIDNGVSENDRIIGIEGYEKTAIEWISTSNCLNHSESNDGDSYINRLEVKIIDKKLWKLDVVAGKAGRRFRIGVITAYGSQKRALKSMVSRCSYANIEVEVDTVDAFQGGQREIIIYSTVRSNSGKNIGFLKSAERLNVSLSRAQSLLIITGDMDFLQSAKRSDFPEIINYIKNRKYCRVIDWSEENE